MKYFVPRAFALLFCMITFCAPTAAQDLDLSGDQSTLRTKQEALFKEMFVRPDDLKVMFEYALISIKLQDFEAAISTLERMLIYKPDLPRVKMELGAAFFRLGSYNSALAYFDQVKASDNVPADVLAQVDRFVSEIEGRKEIHKFVGTASIGVVHNSNANLAPGDVIQVGGIAALNNGNGQAQDDFGLKTTVAFSHLMDLETPNSDAWITDVLGFSLNYDDVVAGDVDFLSIKTGPRLSLDDKEYGTKARPFVDTEIVQSANRTLYKALGAGAEFQDTLTSQLAVFGSVRGSYREYVKSSDDFDGLYGSLTAGLSYRWAPAITLRAGASYSRDESQEDFNKNHRAGLNVSGAYRYLPGYAFAGRPWEASAFASGSLRWFDAPDPLVNPNEKRQDEDVRVGASHTFHFSDGFWSSIGVDALWRDSSLPNFEVTNYGGSVTLGLDF